MKHKFSTRLISLLLVIVTLVGLLIPASAASLGESGTVKITQDGFGNYLTKKSGGTIGGGYWKYTSNNGLTGSAYCVNWGLTGVSPSKSLTVQEYNRNPQTHGRLHQRLSQPDAGPIQGTPCQRRSRHRPTH